MISFSSQCFDVSPNDVNPLRAAIVAFPLGWKFIWQRIYSRLYGLQPGVRELGRQKVVESPLVTTSVIDEVVEY